MLAKLQKQTIKRLNLKRFDLKKHKIDFSGKILEKVNFSGNTLTGINFCNAALTKCDFHEATLIDCIFENAHIIGCDFQGAEIKGTGSKSAAGKGATDKDAVGEDTIASFKDAYINSTIFKGSKISKAKFIRAKLVECDFRYTKVEDTSFKGACFTKSDFHQSAFKGITVFQDSKFKLCSLSYISFEDYCITRHNLIKTKGTGILIQEDETEYEKFLSKLHERKEIMEDKITEALACRYREAELIYRQFTAMWEGKGHNKDGEWAYVQSKIMERKRLFSEVYENKCDKKNKCSEEERCPSENKYINWIKGIGNILSGAFLGYGVRFVNVLIAFLLVIVGFALIYCKLGRGFPDCLITSISFTVGMGERDRLEGAENFLSMAQQGIGIFLLGVFGFMVANKIRKS